MLTSKQQEQKSKQRKIRNSEYYDMVSTFDGLHANSKKGRLNMQITEYHYLRLNMVNVQSLDFLWKCMTYTVTIKCHQAKVVRMHMKI